MKKIAAAFLAGVLVSVSVTAYADDIKSAVGKKIQGTLPLIINGKQAAKDVIVVEGTSYLPVRAAGEMFGYDVDFVDRKVVLKKPAGAASGTSNGTNTGTGSGTGSTAPSSTAATTSPSPSPTPRPTPNVPQIISGEIYTIRSSLVPLSISKGSFIERDGNYYVSVLMFEKNVSNTGTTISISLPNSERAVSFPVHSTYSANCTGYNEDGFYISLKALGLKPLLSGTTVTLVSQ